MKSVTRIWYWSQLIYFKNCVFISGYDAFLETFLNLFWHVLGDFLNHFSSCCIEGETQINEFHWILNFYWMLILLIEHWFSHWILNFCWMLISFLNAENCYWILLNNIRILNHFIEYWTPFTEYRNSAIQCWFFNWISIFLLKNDYQTIITLKII